MYHSHVYKLCDPGCWHRLAIHCCRRGRSMQLFFPPFDLLNFSLGEPLFCIKPRTVKHTSPVLVWCWCEHRLCVSCSWDITLVLRKCQDFRQSLQKTYFPWIQEQQWFTQPARANAFLGDIIAGWLLLTTQQFSCNLQQFLNFTPK